MCFYEHVTARRIDLASSALFVVAWSSGFIGARIGTDQAPVATLLAWRFMLLALLLVVACLIAGVRISAAAIRRQSVLAVTNQVVYLGLVFTGVRAGVTPGIVALIAALQPMLVATVAGPLLGERTTIRQRAGLVLGLAGVGLVVGGDAFTGASAPWWAYLWPAIGMLCLAARRGPAGDSGHPGRGQRALLHGDRCRNRGSRTAGWQVVLGSRGLADLLRQPGGLRIVRLRVTAAGGHPGQHAAVSEPAGDHAVGVSHVPRHGDTAWPCRSGGHGLRRVAGPALSPAARRRRSGSKRLAASHQ